MVGKMKNIVLITVDCLRYDHLKYMKRTLSIPHISFDNIFSNAPFTAFSVTSFLTSKYPPLKRPHRTVASILKEHGYSTAGFVPNVMLIHPKVRKLKIQNGFDVYESYLRDDPTGLIIRAIDRGMTELIDIAGMFIDKFGMNTVGEIINKIIGYYPFTVWVTEQNAQRIIGDAWKWLKNTKEPYFLWVHLMDVHEPYMPPVEYLSLPEKTMYIVNRRLRYTRFWLSDNDVKNLHTLYIDEIKYVDDELYLFINAMISKGAIVILTADHGEQFKEHGGIAHHNWNMHDEQIHVPFLVFGVDKKTDTNKMASLIDLTPTILDLSGIEITEDMGLCGQSLFDKNYREKPVFLAGGSSLLRSWRCMDVLYGIRTKKWKLFKFKDEWVMYDLEKDPMEKHNIINNDEYETIKQSLFYLIKDFRRKKDVWL